VALGYHPTAAAAGKTIGKQIAYTLKPFLYKFLKARTAPCQPLVAPYSPRAISRAY
jgi:hypothetical protein